ncbi:hypothetical protein [Ammoniphilus sp. 3BR4]|uniref:hypothetical protein n=1 Tax=Ammoniphilus sp. 3BR4 TaxID=3158265 RepID=UPI0034662ACD
MKGNQKGITYIELLAALTIATFILSAILYVNHAVFRDFNTIVHKTNSRQIADLAMDQVLQRLRNEDYANLEVKSDRIIRRDTGATVLHVTETDLLIDGYSIKMYGESYRNTRFVINPRLIEIDLNVELDGKQFNIKNSVYYRIP